MARRNLSLLFCLLLIPAVAQVAAPAQRPAPSQTESDEYTRYELLAPETASFRITYDVTATTPGARFFWNGIRRGSTVSDISVIDPASGAALPWELVDGDKAKQNGFAEAGDEAQYIQIQLARPVPKDGEARVRILKTYKDAKSYFAEGDRIIFDRSLGIPRNSVVLPVGYELVGTSYPSQVRTLEDGRVAVSFMNHGRASVPYRVTARKLPVGADLRVRPTAREAATSARAPAAKSSEPVRQGAASSAPTPVERSGARPNFQFSERAFQDREIVYYMLAPETHSFRLFHDYTEMREGMDHYLNVVRAGSKASDPSATNLDTGEALKIETMKGAAARARGIRADEDAFDDSTELVVIWFPAVKKGQSVRLRIWETYTDLNRYVLNGSGDDTELVWDRAFGRPRNAVVLPAGWRLTANSIPAAVSLTDDGRIRLDYMNDRPDDIQVFIRARRR